MALLGAIRAWNCSAGNRGSRTGAAFGKAGPNSKHRRAGCRGLLSTRMLAKVEWRDMSLPDPKLPYGE